MSVLCCQVPQFLITVATRHDKTLADKPMSLVGADERLVAVSREAYKSGVRRGMTPRQAQSRCADVVLPPLNTDQAQSEQSAFAAALTGIGLPVEVATFGAAYVDVREVGKKSTSVQPFCADVGRHVRRQLGQRFEPSIGWDTGKFTSKTAAITTAPGRMLLIDQKDERRFLSERPVEMLPLPSLTMWQLHWLGLRTLGQFANLKKDDVVQGFGPEAKIAHQLARGEDHRPVRPNAAPVPEPVELDFDAPAESVDQVLPIAIRSFKPVLNALVQQLEGILRLRLKLKFLNGKTRTLDSAFIEPLSEFKQLERLLTKQLTSIKWRAALTTLTLAVLEVGELVAHQLTLFDLDDTSAKPSQLMAYACRMTAKYGEVCLTSPKAATSHPLVERRVTLLSAAHSLIA